MIRLLISSNESTIRLKGALMSSIKSKKTGCSLNTPPEVLNNYFSDNVNKLKDFILLTKTKNWHISILQFKSPKSNILYLVPWLIALWKGRNQSYEKVEVF